MCQEGTWKSREFFLAIFSFAILILVQPLSGYKYVSYSGLAVEGQRTNHRFEIPTSKTMISYVYPIPPVFLVFISLVFVGDL